MRGWELYILYTSLTGRLYSLYKGLGAIYSIQEGGVGSNLFYIGEVGSNLCYTGGVGSKYYVSEQERQVAIYTIQEEQEASTMSLNRIECLLCKTSPWRVLSPALFQTLSTILFKKFQIFVFQTISVIFHKLKL